jgi:hypothetical protein
MANFFTDNLDIQFLFRHMDLARAATIMEDGFRYAAEFDHAPTSAGDAIDNYQRILGVLGKVAAEEIAPTADQTDRIGNRLNDDGTVTRPPGIAHALKRLSEADLMGFTLPYRFGGLNCPTLLYTMSIEIVSRADAALMNLYGLQGIAETIEAFADEPIKQAYLPDMAAGTTTGAMVLTEPDAGSDLQSVKCRAYQDADGQWRVSGVKRFITNGCGEVLLVLARSEADIADGRGLSLLLVDNDEHVEVRRIEDKLGIHGSPTCELYFNDAPAKLIGERQRGLISYVMSLMNGARIGIAAQSLGIGEAAFRVARSYASHRRQFGRAIEQMPAVREMLCNMAADLAGARALTYHASFCVDIEHGALRKLEDDRADADAKKQAKADSRRYKRINGLLTPMCKYYASEMCSRVANDAISVLGGSGYMRDYPVERHLRDARITTIYEGTSQLQVVAAVRGVSSGTAAAIVQELLDRDWPETLAPAVEQIRQGLDLLAEAVENARNNNRHDDTDLFARRIVEMAIALIVGALFCDQAAADEQRMPLLHRWLATKMPELHMHHQAIEIGDRSTMTDFGAVVGDVPRLD